MICYDVVRSYSVVSNYRAVIEMMMLMVEKHKRDYRNDGDLVVIADRLYIEHEQFPFLDFVHCDGSTI